MKTNDFEYLIYELEIELIESDPRIWRKILVPNHINFYDLHCIFQKTMGWLDCHLHSFEIEILGKEIVILDTKSDDAQDMIEDLTSEILGSGENKKVYLEQKKESLYSVCNNKICTFQYTYDFGDNWKHKVTIKNITKPNDLHTYPLCIGGQNACPPEDCMGIEGYHDFLKNIKNKSNKEYVSSLKWVGGHFDPVSFCPNSINRSLHYNKNLSLKSNKFNK